MRFYLRAIWSIIVIWLVLNYVPAPWCWVWVGVIVFGWLLIVLWAFMAAAALNSFGRRR